MPAILRLCRLLALLLVLLPVHAEAQGRSYQIEEFHATLRVTESGTIEVLERIRFRFDGSFEGIYRRIPVRYRSSSGFDHRLQLEVEGIADPSGRELRWEDHRDGDYRRFQVWVPGATDTVRTVLIRYRVLGGLRFFDGEGADRFAGGHDELYWNVTGAEWSVPIRAASSRVELPDGVTGLRAEAFTGPPGSQESAVDIQEIPEGVSISSTRSLSPGEGLTVVIGWEPGVVERPGALRRASFFFRANWILLLPILVAGAMGWLWHTRGRDPRLRSVAPWYEPPDGLTPAEIGTLLDDRPDARDISATLVDLAVRGYLTIEEIEEGGLRQLFTGADYRFHRAREADGWGDLEHHEREVLVGLFGEGGHQRSVKLSDLKNEFYEHLRAIRDGIFRRLVGMGFYQRRPDRVRRRYMVAAGAIVALGVVAFQGGMFAPGASPLALGVAVVGSALPVFGFGYFMPARTRRGTRKLEEILGFQEFLDRVEEDRFRRMITSPDQFEVFLPHAMALGVDATWARAFEDVVTRPPDWYSGSPATGGFRTTAFTESLGTMSARAGAALTSAPRGGGGSGFSGGSAGGGFGGGGGGAF